MKAASSSENSFYKRELEGSEGLRLVIFVALTTLTAGRIRLSLERVVRLQQRLQPLTCYSQQQSVFAEIARRADLLL